MSNNNQSNWDYNIGYHLILYKNGYTTYNDIVIDLNDISENILDINVRQFEYETKLYTTVEVPQTGGVNTTTIDRDILLHFTKIEDNLIITDEDENIYVEIPLLELLELFSNEDKIPRGTQQNAPSKENRANISQSGGYVHIKNIGKRKIRYYKNGNPYVIVKGKKKRL
jgi:hypothetical protein